MLASCTSNVSLFNESYCPAYHDTFFCWPATMANTTITGPCPLSDVFKAYRVCTEDGNWLTNVTNYSACFESYPNIDETFVKVIKDLIFITSIVSLLFLIIALFIFCYFRSLQCNRISIHKQLVVAFIINFSILVYQTQPNYYVYRKASQWICKCVLATSKVSQMATFSWMLVEGIYLHNRLVVTVFPSAAPFRLFYFIGWGLPILFTVLWSALMYMDDKSECWDDFTKNSLVFIILAPIILALIINSAFLVNIIRVLVTKYRNNNLMESRRIRKAIKATVILLPLLGVSNLLTFVWPPLDPALSKFSLVINAVFPPCQGIFVSVLYCFINSEVQNAIKKKWRRCLTTRALNTRTRRQGSRTSSYFLSQSDVPARRNQTIRSTTTATRDRDYHSMSVLNTTSLFNATTPEFDLKKVAL